MLEVINTNQIVIKHPLQLQLISIDNIVHLCNKKRKKCLYLFIKVLPRAS